MYEKVQTSALTHMLPFICISAIWDQHPVFWFIRLPHFLAYCREWQMTA